MRTLKIILLTMGAMVVMLNFSGCSENVKYEKYSSKDPALGITVDYISGWKAAEQTGAYGSFTQTVFYEPSIANKPLKAMMVVTVEPSDKIKISSPTLEKVELDLVGRRMKFKDSKVMSKTGFDICGEKGIDIKMSYRALDNIESIKGKLMPVAEHVIMFKKGEKFYTLRYENLSSEFDKYDKAFYHCARSLKLK